MDDNTFVSEGRVVRVSDTHIQATNSYFIEAYRERAVTGGMLILCPYGVVAVGDRTDETFTSTKVRLVLWDIGLGEYREGDTWVEKPDIELVEDPSIVESVLERSNTLGTTTESGTLRMGGTGQRDNTTGSTVMTQSVLEMQMNRVIYNIHTATTDSMFRSEYLLHE